MQTCSPKWYTVVVGSNNGRNMKFKNSKFVSVPAAISTCHGRQYFLEELVPVPPTGKSKRWGFKAVRVAGPFDARWKVERWSTPAWDARRDVQAIRIVKLEAGKLRTVFTFAYTHGKLGYLDTGFTMGYSRHASDCPKCSALESIVPIETTPAWDRSAKKKTWEDLEALVAAYPHSKEAPR